MRSTIVSKAACREAALERVAEDATHARPIRRRAHLVDRFTAGHQSGQRASPGAVEDALDRRLEAPLRDERVAGHPYFPSRGPSNRSPNDAARCASRDDTRRGCVSPWRRWTSSSSAARRPSPARSSCSITERARVLDRLRDVPGQPERVDPQPDPVRLRPGDARRDAPDPRPPRPLRPAPARRQATASAARSTRRPATVELAELVLLDSGQLQEEFAKREARWERRHPDEADADDRRSARRTRPRSSSPRTASAGRTPSRRSRRSQRVRGRGGRAPTPRRSRPAATSEATASPPTSARAAPRRQWRPATPRPSCARQPPHLEIDLDAPLYTAEDAERALRAVPRRRLRRGDRGRAGHPRDVRRRRPHPRLGDHPAARRASRGRRGADRSSSPATSAGPGTPIMRDPTIHDRRRLRPRRVDLRRPRARARRRRRSGSWPRRSALVADAERRAARPVVRDRPDPGGRLAARPADRARRDPAAAALPRLADGLEGVRHLPPPPRVLRRGDRAAAARRATTPLDYPNQIDHQRRRGVAGDRARRRGRT